MFEKTGQRYMTRAIAESVPQEVIQILWQLIDTLQVQKVDLDYLQVFELSRQEDGRQTILHRQEVPKLRNLLHVQLAQEKPFTGTIWCIDSEETEMMLFPEDY